MITGPDFTDNRGGMTGFLEKVSIRGIFEKVDLINSEFLKEIRITDGLSGELRNRKNQELFTTFCSLLFRLGIRY